MSDTANPFAVLMPAFEAWFERHVPEPAAWDRSAWDLALMAFMAGHSTACQAASPEAMEAARRIMLARVDEFDSIFEQDAVAVARALLSLAGTEKT